MSLLRDAHGILFVILLAACSTTNRPEPPLPADPRAILQSNLSHGLGASPFDSPLVQDSMVAALLVRLRGCLPVEDVGEVIGRAGDTSGLLEDLESAGLVLMDDGNACTAFPILIHEEQAAYARITAAVAEDAAEFLSGDIAALLAGLEERGWLDWQYHFVWSQLFDSQFAWVTMTRRQLVPELRRVIAWSSYPDHPYRSGTNYFPDTELRDYWLMVTWRPGATHTVSEAAKWWEVLYGTALEGRTLSAAERSQLDALALTDGTGELQLPVVSAGDDLLRELETLATRYVEFLEKRLPIDSLSAVTRVDPGYTFAMAYHDVSWGILQRLVSSGRLGLPAALVNGAESRGPTLRGVGALVPVYGPFADLVREALGG